MRADGSLFRRIESYSGFPWRNIVAFAPSGDVVYTQTDDGALVRHDLARGTADTIWRPSRANWNSPQQLTVSPDGRRIAVSMTVAPEVRLLPSGERTTVSSLDELFVVSSDGSRSSLVDAQPRRTERGMTMDMLTVLGWSPDGRSLLYLRTYGAGRVYLTRALSWREGGKALVTSFELPMGPWQSATAPDGSMLIVSKLTAWVIAPDGRARRLGETVAAAFGNTNLVGIDAEGQAILETPANGNHSYLAALDLNTGKLTRIYP
jgi:dipeptidyl aminopeptidase/acylaminoacyl peptidase